MIIEYIPIISYMDNRIAVIGLITGIFYILKIGL